MQSYAKLRGVRLQLCLVGVPCRCLQLHNVPAGLQVLQVSDLQPFPRTRNKMQQAVVCLSVLVLLEKKEAALQKNLKRRLNVLGLVALDLKIFKDFKELRKVGPQLLLVLRVLRVLRVPFFHILSFGLEPAVLRSPWDEEAIGAATSAPGAHDRRGKESQEEPRAQVISSFRLSMFLHVLSFLLMSVHFFSFMACHNRVM